MIVKGFQDLDLASEEADPTKLEDEQVQRGSADHGSGWLHHTLAGVRQTSQGDCHGDCPGDWDEAQF